MEPRPEADILLQRKQKLTHVAIGLLFLLSGIEYAVILPTVWMYLQSLDAQPFFLGLVLSAFSLTELLSGPAFGYWSDRTGKTKNVILLSNCFEIAGPAFNVFLRYCTFQIGPFHVDKFSAPGLFMCILWILMQFVVIFMFRDLPLNPLESPHNEREPLLQQNDTPSPLYGAINCVHDPSTNQDDSSSMENPNASSAFPITNNHVCPEWPKSNGTTKKPLIGLLREEVVVLLTAQFVTFFNQTALETLVTPLAQTYLGFQDLQNSLLYFLCGIEMLIGFLVVRFLSRCCSDRILLVFGLLISNISCIWCLLFLAKPKGSYGFLLAEFVIGVFLQVLGLPFVSVAQVSLFSKLTAEKTQGFNHGVRRSVGGLATILGPLWAAGLTQNLYIMLGTMMGLLLLISVMVILSYKYLVDPAASEEQ
ncbi:uncharacterized protein [Engystomops pustulosus]|uniref:uncharacterized protein isoform X3 n=1 Tax=Engystomops pustulosus TaxID=76066 RepID=UPI003AFA0E44